jgi:hypothetical protein
MLEYLQRYSYEEIARHNKATAQLANCDDNELDELFTAAGILAQEIDFSVKWRDNNFSKDLLKCNLRDLADFWSKYKETGEGYHPFQAFKFARRFTIPAPVWVEQWLDEGFEEFDRNEGKIQLETALRLTPGKQGSSSNWAKNNQEEKERDILLEVVALNKNYGFSVAVAKEVVSLKWNKKTDTLEQYRKKHKNWYNSIKNDPFFLDCFGKNWIKSNEIAPHWEAVVNRDERNLPPKQLEKAKTNLTRLLKES